MNLSKDDFKAVSVLANDFGAFDLADHLADVVAEIQPDGRSIWDMSAFDLAILALSQYPGGAMELQMRMQDTI